MSDPTDPTPWGCARCEAEIGKVTRALMKVRLDAVVDAKFRVTEGSHAWVCACCLVRGRLTYVSDEAKTSSGGGPTGPAP